MDVPIGVLRAILHPLRVFVTAVKELPSSTSVLVDSGAALHVCPVNWVKDAVLLQSTKAIRLQTASGQVLKVQGIRRVFFRSREHYFPVNFVVTDVTTPIMSVMQLLRNGVHVHFSAQDSYLEFPQNVRIPLHCAKDSLA